METTRWNSTPFLNWARKQRLLRGIAIPPRTIRTSPTIGNDERTQHLHAVLLHDELPMHYRLIAAFVLLFGQSLSRIVPLTREHVDVSGPTTRLVLADDDWIDLPEPIATPSNRNADEQLIALKQRVMSLPAVPVDMLHVR
jgi:hypothetical protein